MLLSRRILLGAASALFATTGAFAQAWPAKPITMVVPFPPGGPTDLVARVLAQKLTEQLGQSVVVDNKGGANGNIGAQAVARAPADGYTILYNTSSITLSPALYKNLSYSVEKDFAPVALTAVVPLALVVHPGVPANNVKEFIAYAKANPGKLTYGSAGNGNVTHLGAFQFTQANGIDAVHAPFKGSAPADVALVAGEIQYMTDTINSVMQFIKDKRIKLLAVTSAKRMSLFPDVPTLAESGMAGFEVGAWQGVMVPAATPKAVVDRLNAEILKALQNPDLKAKLAGQGAEPLGSTPAEYGAYVKKEIARWATVVKASGVTIE
ncbi:MULTISPECIES: Bug family tripartite tricarboxylate transporter substrate binding protein [Ramlibacter]|uniref:Tripartite tricarboxylate transporter substrate binding protein n=1 Tax=Ramlibacter pinisoli TaxID=2682844 RepID=A0A6N8IPP7_9BURK|nr:MULTISPECIES: tripartite tricarboxylate transporter substrate binding protein [Ramlibacter]MBA2963818.1 tripartite tricarboxylate transporter substrate binding protein [Ramlibacter sp. CGMCC 1.13660]MVQ28784.1 tripartite tricarboxylate transporter substrate binding protein [Ramlibacter pinisoli]